MDAGIVRVVPRLCALFVIIVSCVELSTIHSVRLSVQRTASIHSLRCCYIVRWVLACPLRVVQLRTRCHPEDSETEPQEPEKAIIIPGLHQATVPR